MHLDLCAKNGLFIDSIFVSAAAFVLSGPLSPTRLWTKPFFFSSFYLFSCVSISTPSFTIYSVTPQYTESKSLSLSIFPHLTTLWWMDFNHCSAKRYINARRHHVSTDIYDVIVGETYRKHCGYWLRTGSSYWRWIEWMQWRKQLLVERLKKGRKQCK